VGKAIGAKVDEDEFFGAKLLVEALKRSDPSGSVEFFFATEFCGGGDHFKSRSDSGVVYASGEGFKPDDSARLEAVDRLIVGDDAILGENIIEPATGNLGDEFVEGEGSPRLEGFVGGISDGGAGCEVIGAQSVDELFQLLFPAQTGQVEYGSVEVVGLSQIESFCDDMRSVAVDCDSRSSVFFLQTVAGAEYEFAQ
jgi:hypothetical protein